MMRARLVVFPVKGRNWCFSRSVDSLIAGDSSTLSTTPTTVRDLWKSLSSSSQPSVTANAELVVDFVSHKMNTAWSGLEKAPQGSFKNKIHGVGLWLLSRVKPSELFLKSISKEVAGVEVTYPTSVNARLIRRRLRHIAMSGSIIHKKYLYASAALLPVTTVFMVLPLPNIPFFWMLFRTYSHWRAWQGSEKLLQLVSDGSDGRCSSKKETESPNRSHDGSQEVNGLRCVFEPSKQLEELVRRGNANGGLSKCVMIDICKTFELNPQEVLRYQNL
ncbi:hypothetical protein SOVF_124030 [Spinacia oleracea]|uniref:Letm1 RBD domain-containing protein n=1 Tax=Spinacia oleracea TaxID=3562 RepID=A0A9R0IE48_SPIOL|nr:uncharacterized protein LOC110787190 [Spinacia oleracea]KNA12624.1 hypothetical protein SOVF_124030 [Spinacia oleracea]